MRGEERERGWPHGEGRRGLGGIWTPRPTSRWGGVGRGKGIEGLVGREVRERGVEGGIQCLSFFAF